MSCSLKFFLDLGLLQPWTEICNILTGFSIQALNIESFPGSIPLHVLLRLPSQLWILPPSLFTVVSFLCFAFLLHVIVCHVRAAESASLSGSSLHLCSFPAAPMAFRKALKRTAIVGGGAVAAAFGLSQLIEYKKTQVSGWKFDQQTERFDLKWSRETSEPFCAGLGLILECFSFILHPELHRNQDSTRTFCSRSQTYYSWEAWLLHHLAFLKWSVGELYSFWRRSSNRKHVKQLIYNISGISRI